MNLKATPITGTPILGKISTGIRIAAIGPKIRINSAMTMKVSGRSSAILTREVHGWRGSLRQGAWTGA